MTAALAYSPPWTICSIKILPMRATPVSKKKNNRIAILLWRYGLRIKTPPVET
jgi:hypothetical protein